MKKVIKVSIPEPCHEDWGKMTQTEKGKFCQVCTKEVVDFTKAIDEDIVKHVLKHDNACGRFSKSQLDRELTLERSSGQRIAPLAASLLLPLSMMASSLAAPKQGGVSTKTYTSLGIGSMHKKANRIQITVAGKVTDISGNALASVRVEVEETGEKTFTDRNGQYSITFLDKDTLLFFQEGFEQSKHKAGNYDEVFNLELQPEKQLPMIMGKMIMPTPIIETDMIKGDIVAVDDEVVSITGVITDESGLPLPGANVIVKGTNIGTQSDFDGNYTINAPENSKITFSYVGFGNVEIQISNIDNNFDVSMADGGYLSGEIIICTIREEISSFSPFENFRRTEYTPEQLEQRAARKNAEANGLAFKKLKMAKEKETRKQKRRMKKK